jgi:hypothetical protein
VGEVGHAVYALGTEVTLSASSLVYALHGILISDSGLAVSVEMVPISELAGYVGRKWEAMKSLNIGDVGTVTPRASPVRPVAPGAFEDLRDRLRAPREPGGPAPDPGDLLVVDCPRPGAGTSIGVQADAGDDARTLWLDSDPHEQRWNDYREAVHESYTVALATWDQEGPPSAIGFLKFVLKNGGDPRRWFTDWKRLKRLEDNDRVCHAMKVLVDVLWYGLCFDQLNGGACAVFEVVCRRLQAIMNAYSNLARPNWAAARLFEGGVDVDAGIQADLRSFVARKAKEEQELRVMQTRATGAWSGDAGDLDGGAPAAGPGATGGVKGGRPGAGSRKQRGLAAKASDDG